MVLFECLLSPSQFDACTMQFLVNNYDSCAFSNRTGEYQIRKRDSEDNVFVIAVRVSPNKKLRRSEIRVTFVSGTTPQIRTELVAELIENIGIVDDSVGNLVRTNADRDRPTSQVSSTRLAGK